MQAGMICHQWSSSFLLPIPLQTVKEFHSGFWHIVTVHNIPFTCKYLSRYLLVWRGTSVFCSDGVSCWAAPPILGSWRKIHHSLLSLILRNFTTVSFILTLSHLRWFWSCVSSISTHPPLWSPIALKVFCDHKYNASPTNLTQTELSFFSCLMAPIVGDHQWSWAGDFFHFHSPCITYSVSALEANYTRKLWLPIS